MPRLGFGAFLAPHHPSGKSDPAVPPDLKFVEHIDELGYDEFWCGEHHSSGWETIASPEMFLAAAGERTKRIKLAPGDLAALPSSLQCRAAHGAARPHDGGPGDLRLGTGALPSDAHTLGIDPMASATARTTRSHHPPPVQGRAGHGQDRLVHLQDAALQLLPLQEDMPFAVASQISPSGMTLAGKYGIGIISLGSMSDQGLLSLPTQWGFAEAAQEARHRRRSQETGACCSAGTSPRHARRRAKRPSTACCAGTTSTSPHPAAPGRRAVRLARRCGRQDGLHGRRRLDHRHARRSREDDKSVYDKSGGFGTVVGFVHDWANPENTMRSWDMVARYVIPEINGYVTSCASPQKFLIDNRAVFDRAARRIMAKIMENDAAAAALKVTNRRASRRVGIGAEAEVGKAGGGGDGPRPPSRELANDLGRAQPHRGVGRPRRRSAATGSAPIRDIDADAIQIGVTRPVALDDDDTGSRGERGPGAQT